MALRLGKRDLQKRDNSGIEAGMTKQQENFWKDCPLVEIVEGKQGGAPVLQGTRIPVEQLVEEFELGSSLEEIAENYDVTREDVRKLLAFKKSHQPQPAF